MSGELHHLVKMANQIANNIGIGATEEQAIAKVQDHITKFWARPMREKICAELDGLSDELTPIANKALGNIKATL